MQLVHSQSEYTQRAAIIKSLYNTITRLASIQEVQLPIFSSTHAEEGGNGGDDPPSEHNVERSSRASSNPTDMYTSSPPPARAYRKRTRAEAMTVDTNEEGKNSNDNDGHTGSTVAAPTLALGKLESSVFRWRS